MSGTVRKRHPRGQEKIIESIREEQAKAEWAFQQNNIQRIIAKIVELPLEARKQILNKFCPDCAANDIKCQCYKEIE